MSFLKSMAVISGVLLSVLGGIAHASANEARAPQAADFELLESKPLNNGWGTLRLWRKLANGCVHAEVASAPAGTVATERDDGQIMTFATNPSGGTTSTRQTSAQFGAIRAAMFSDGVITYTKYYSSISPGC